MSSAYSKSSNLMVKFHRIPVLFSAVYFLITQSITKRNKNPEMLQPCLTPDLILNHSEVPLGVTTAHSLSLYLYFTRCISFSGIP